MAKIKAFILVFINCIMLVLGEVWWKIGLTQQPLNGFNVSDFIKVILNKYIIAGMLIYVAATVFWFYILEANDFNKVYPMQSMCYIISLFLGYWILKEPLTIRSIIGSIVIVIGVFIFAFKF